MKNVFSSETCWEYKKVIIIVIIKVYIQNLGKSKRNIKCITIRSSLIVLNHDPNQPPRGFYADERCGDITASLAVGDCLGELKHMRRVF